jgi:hypothetical protein
MLPWDWVKPGLSLSLTDEQGRNGQLAAEGIEFAAPAELVLHTIRVGMLTAPPKSNSHWLSLEPVRAATDYFQTIPVARITAAQYEDVQFNRVMVGSGAIYDVDGASHNPVEPTFSPVEGGVYAGDMRENTGKSTISVGINLANRRDQFEHGLAKPAATVPERGRPPHRRALQQWCTNPRPERWQRHAHALEQPGQ